MPIEHRVFGLTLHTSLPLPGLPELPARSAADVVIERSRDSGPEAFGVPGEDRYRSVPLTRGGDGAVLEVWKERPSAAYRFRYPDGCEFRIEEEARRIRMWWPDDLTLEDAATYLLGPVLGFVLRLRGTVCLHASAVVIDGQAVALAAPAGVGKSTLAALFALRGFPILSDDVVALLVEDETVLVPPALPRVQLWPPAVTRLFGEPAALPRISPSHPEWDKRYLQLEEEGAHRFARAPCPLAAVYAAVRRPGVRSLRVEPLGGQAGLTTLLANSYVDYLLDPPMRARNLEILTMVAERVRLRGIVAESRMPHTPEEISDAILEDLRAGDV